MSPMPAVGSHVRIDRRGSKRMMSAYCRLARSSAQSDKVIAVPVRSTGFGPGARGGDATTGTSVLRAVLLTDPVNGPVIERQPEDSFSRIVVPDVVGQLGDRSRPCSRVAILSEAHQLHPSRLIDNGS